MHRYDDKYGSGVYSESEEWVYADASSIGHIHCRLSNGSDELGALGEFLVKTAARHASRRSALFFRVREQDGDEKDFEISHDVLLATRDEKVFAAPFVTVNTRRGSPAMILLGYLGSQPDTELIAISGFPQILNVDEIREQVPGPSQAP